MENGPFIYDFPINTSICKGFSMAMLNNQMVINFGYRLTHCFIASLRSYQTMKNGMWSRGSQFDGISELPLGHMVSSKSYRLYRCLCLIFFDWPSLFFNGKQK